MHLLRTAFQIKIHPLYAKGIIEISHVRIVERNVPVLPYPHENDVDMVRGKNPVITGGKVFRIPFAADIIHASKRDFVENRPAEEIAKPLRSIGRKTYIFVHMKSMNTVPVNSFRPAQGIQEFVLRRCGSKNRPHFILFCQQSAKILRRFFSGFFSHFTARTVHFHFKFVNLKFFHCDKQFYPL